MKYRPMLASPWDRPFSDHGWVFEPKFDGVRAIAEIDHENLIIWSRSGRMITDGYPELRSLRGRQAVLDGEIVAFDEHGRPSFERLQSRMHVRGRRAAELSESIPVGYAVFDLLELNGVSLIRLPLEERTGRLAALDLPDRIIRVEQIPEEGEALFEAVAAAGIEGIVAKRLGSPYRPGVRSPDWRKIPHVRRVRAVVGGFTAGEGSRIDSFGALLVGMWDGPRLRWAGAVGTGFDAASQRAIRHALDQMQSEECPFHPDPALPREAVWVEPVLVAEVEFKQWTAAGRLRAPAFKGFSDQPPESVTWEAEAREYTLFNNI